MLEIGSRPVIVVSLKEPNISALWLDVNNADEIKLKVFNDTLGAWQEIYSPPYLSIVNRLDILEADVLTLQNGIAQIGQDINNINQSIVLIEAEVLAVQGNITNINTAIGNINTALGSKMDIVLGSDGELPELSSLGQLQTTQIKSTAVRDSNIHFLNKPQFGNGITETYYREEDTVIIPIQADSVYGFDPLTYDGFLSFYIGKVEDADSLVPATVNFGDEKLKIRYENGLGNSDDVTIYLSDHGNYAGNTPSTLKDVLGKQVLCYFIAGFQRSCVLVGVEKVIDFPIVEEDIPEIVTLSNEGSITYTVDLDTASYVSITTTPDCLNPEIILENLTENKAITFSVMDGSIPITIDTDTINEGDVALAIFDFDTLTWSVNITTAAEAAAQPVPTNGDFSATYAVPTPVSLTAFGSGFYRTADAQIFDMNKGDTFVLIAQTTKSQNKIFKKVGSITGGDSVISVIVSDPSKIRTVSVLNNNLIYGSYYRGILTNLYYNIDANSTEYVSNKKPIVLKGTTVGAGTVQIGTSLPVPISDVFTFEFDVKVTGYMSGIGNKYVIYRASGIDAHDLNDSHATSGNLSLFTADPGVGMDGLYYTLIPGPAGDIRFYYRSADSLNIGSVITLTINNIA